MTSTLGVQPRHGAVTQPRSRAEIHFGDWRAHGLEAGKFFPATESNMRDSYAPDDVVSATPPPDGKIASAGRDFATELDQVRTDWQKTPVKAGQQLDISWTYHARHLTRRWNYFITRNDWDPSKPLTRAQFEPAPFQQEQLACQPYWSCANDLIPPDPTEHSLRLPQRSGYHVILAVWEVADTGNAFYQVIDVEFS